MKYDEMKKLIFAYGTRPDGYNGKTVRVGFAWLKQHCYEIAPCGYYPASIPPSIDVKEAYWLLCNHPTASNITQLEKVDS